MITVDVAELQLSVDRGDPSPVYLQISEQIRGKILRGELLPGARIPNGQDLSREFGVAYRTVVRSLEILKKEGLLVGVQSRGTFVRSAVREVRNIAVTFDRLYYQDIATDLDRFQRGASGGCESAKLNLQLFPLADANIFNDDEPTLLSTLLRDRQIDGVVTYHAPAPEDIDRLVKMNLPTVTSRDIYPGTGVPWVIEDVADAARQLARFLVGGLGHRRVGLVMGPGVGSTGRVVRPTGLLADSLVAEFRAHGVGCPPERVLHSDFRWERVAPAVRAWLTSPDRPTAIICCSPALAMEVIALARELGLDVPRDLSVASFGESAQEQVLTAISLPLESMAVKCVELLEQAMRGEKVAPVEIPVDLVIRQTCGPASRS